MKISVNSVGDVKDIGPSKQGRQRLALKKVLISLDGQEFEIFDVLAYSVTKTDSKPLDTETTAKASKEPESVQKAVAATAARRKTAKTSDAPPTAPEDSRVAALEAQVASIGDNLSKLLKALGQ